MIVKKEISDENLSALRNYADVLIEDLINVASEFESSNKANYYAGIVSTACRIREILSKEDLGKSCIRINHKSISDIDDFDIDDDNPRKFRRIGKELTFEQDNSDCKDHGKNMNKNQ